MLKEFIKDEKIEINLDSNFCLENLFFDEIMPIPKLSPDEEVLLAKEIEIGVIAERVLGKGGKKKLHRDFAHQLIKETRRGRESAKKLILAHEGLAIHFAKKYKSEGVSFLDLIQEANIGLLEASQKFDYRMDVRFASYAYYFAKVRVLKKVYELSQSVRIPYATQVKINKMREEINQSLVTTGIEPSMESLAEKLKVKTKKIDELKSLDQGMFSLNFSSDYEGEEETSNEEKLERIEDTSVRVEENTFKNIVLFNIEAKANELPEKWVRVLRLRFGLEDGRNYSLVDTGRVLGISRERVRQIEKKALKRLKLYREIY